jgi:MFS family permease
MGIHVVATRRDLEAWFQLCAIAMATFLCMSLWFSASAVGRQLQSAWDLTVSEVSWLTVSVTVGFVTGTLASAALNLPDRMRAERLLAISALTGGLVNLLIPILAGHDESGHMYPLVIVLRFVTGMTLAGVYPPGMKLMASWFPRNRGLAIGILVGALTLGSALPYLLLFFTRSGWLDHAGADWQGMMCLVSGAAGLAAILAAIFIRPGPHLARSTRLDWRYFIRAWRDEPLRRANFGYLGHQWELYAMWTWAPPFLHRSFRDAEYSEASAHLAGFSVIAIGCLSCIIAGWYADRAGRTRTTIISLVVSGACCLVVGHLAGHPILLLMLCLVWGALVISDSAQYSAAITELCDPQLVGTALTIQTCAGFLLTAVTIYLLPAVRGFTGDGIAFSLLALGPVFGIWHMYRLRRMPESARMAGGNR